MTGQRQCKIEKSINSANGTYSGGHQSLCLLNCLRSKNTLKQGTFLIFFKLTAKPRVLENLKRSWKKSWHLESSKECKRYNVAIALVRENRNLLLT